MYQLNALDGLLRLDRQLFNLINERGSSTLLDIILPFLRESQFWVPFYLFMLLFMTFNFGKMGLWWMLVFILTAILADIISSHIIKENIMRIRPCRDPALAAEVIFRVNYCPKSSSFTSSHATSHFALSMFIYQTLKRVSKWWGMVFICMNRISSTPL